MSDIWAEVEIVDGVRVLRCPDSWLDNLDAAASAEGLPPGDYIAKLRERARRQPPTETAVRDLTAQLKRFGRIVRERVRTPRDTRPGHAAFSQREVARRLGVRRSTLRDLIREGKVRTIQWGKSVRIPSAEMLRLETTGLPSAGLGPPAAPKRRRAAAAPPPSGVGDRIRALPYGRRSSPD